VIRVRVLSGSVPDHGGQATPAPVVAGCVVRGALSVAPALTPALNVMKEGLLGWHAPACHPSEAT